MNAGPCVFTQTHTCSENSMFNNSKTHTNTHTLVIQNVSFLNMSCKLQHWHISVCLCVVWTIIIRVLEVHEPRGSVWIWVLLSFLFWWVVFGLWWSKSSNLQNSELIQEDYGAVSSCVCEMLQTFRETFATYVIRVLFISWLAEKVSASNITVYLTHMPQMKFNHGILWKINEKSQSLRVRDIKRFCHI